MPDQVHPRVVRSSPTVDVPKMPRRADTDPEKEGGLMIGDGSEVEINPNYYKKDLPIPSNRHPCQICGRPANYRTPFDPVTLKAEWLCPECYKEIAKQLDDLDDKPDEPKVKVITEYAGEDRITHMEKTISTGVRRGRDRESIYSEVLYDNEWMYNPRFTPMELQEQFDKLHTAALGTPEIQIGDIEAVISEGSGGKKSYQNHPEHGIILYTVRGSANGPIENVEYIFSYRIRSIERIENPADNIDVCYNIVFENVKKPSQRLRYDELTISQIASDIISSKSGVKNKQRLHEAISAIINEYEARELIRVSSRIPATGFFEDGNGALQFHEGKKLKLSLPKHNPKMAAHALEVLNDIMAFHSYSDRALTILYQMAYGPLGFIRKTYGKENKMVIAHGEPHTGKTYLCRICGYFWGLSETDSVIAAGKLTAPQLAEHLNKTTFMITLDEARNTIGDPNIVEMLKSSTTNTRIKDRIRPEQGYRMQSLYAYATVTLTTNFMVQLHAGMQDRLISSEWLTDAKRAPEEVERYEEVVNQNKEDLSYIGAALKAMFLERWETIKPLLFKPDQIDIGMEIMRRLYQYLDLPVPEWIRKVTESYEIDSPDPLDVFFGYMRQTYLENIRLYDKGLLTMDLSWESRLIQMHRTGISPAHTISITEKYIAVVPSIIQDISRERGYDLPGGLKNLQYKIPGAKYQVYRRTKALMIPTATFVDYMAPLVLGEGDIQP